jgi:hypothetical protein
MKTAEKIDDYTLCIHLKAALLDSVLTPQPDMDVPDTHLGIAFAIPIAPPLGPSFPSTQYSGKRPMQNDHPSEAVHITWSHETSPA